MTQALTPKEFKTITDLILRGFKTPEEVISFCETKLKLPHKHTVRFSKDPTRPSRRHSRVHYRNIIAAMKG